MTAPVMPFKDASVQDKVQVFVSDYLLDSLTYALFKTPNATEMFSVTVPHTVVPAGHPLELNTTALDLIFPGMVAKYGKDRFVDIQAGIKGLSNFSSKQSQLMSANADMSIKFNVEKADGTNETAIDLTFE